MATSHFSMELAEKMLEMLNDDSTREQLTTALAAAKRSASLQQELEDTKQQLTRMQQERDAAASRNLTLWWESRCQALLRSLDGFRLVHDPSIIVSEEERDTVFRLITELLQKHNRFSCEGLWHQAYRDQWLCLRETLKAEPSQLEEGNISAQQMYCKCPNTCVEVMAQNHLSYVWARLSKPS